MPKALKRILVVNDDGIYGPGLMPLVKALRRVGEVTTVVPERERSTASHALTLHKPVRLQPVERQHRVYTLSGTPSDCARFGILHVMKEKVDLIVSGINRGYNLGEDVLYSGTVGAAYEGALVGIPALAVSREWGQPMGFETSAQVALKVVGRLLKHELPRGMCLNLNIPDLPRTRLKPVTVATLGKRIYSKEIAARKDPRGRKYYWMMGTEVSGVPGPGTDVAAVDAGHPALTPLLVDLTDHARLTLLRQWHMEK